MGLQNGDRFKVRASIDEVAPQKEGKYWITDAGYIQTMIKTISVTKSKAIITEATLPGDRVVNNGVCLTFRVTATDLQGILTISPKLRLI